MNSKVYYFTYIVYNIYKGVFTMDETKLDVTKEIQKILLEENLSKSYLAEKLNFSQANLSKKFKLNNYRINDLEEIAKAIGYKVEIKFIKISE